MGQVNLVGIKEAIQTILENANTTTASPVDLSANLSTRVQNILKVDPNRIGVQADFYPYVTVFLEEKAPVADTISNTQAASRRLRTVTYQVAGVVYHDAFSSNEDPADDEIEYLMENIEETLRSNTTLSDTVLWQNVGPVRYHSAAFDDNAILRAGLLTLEARVQY